MTTPSDPSRDLLFGLLALQNGLIDQGALFAAFAAWTRDKGRSLSDHLIDLGHLDDPRRVAIEAIALLHVQALGGDPGKSLAVLATNRSTRESLARAGGPEVEATLGHVDSALGSTQGGDDAERTATYSVGAATSDGQRFRILRPHAKGGLGAVFVALDSELNREVALKQILEKHADDPVGRQRFVAEAQITGGLEHPGVVPVYGLGTDAGGRPYYAMRFIKGDSLKEVIDVFHGHANIRPIATLAGKRPGGGATGVPDGSRDLEFRKLLVRFLDVCNAIDYAHSRGVIHRDLKPANIIVGKHGETLVVDWGLAKAVGRADPSVGEQTLAPSSSGSSETQRGSALGTPAYMSPEQARGDLAKLGPRSDVYSLGATLYCLLTGKPPFGGDDVGVILHAVEEGRFPRPSQHDPSIDLALERVCVKAMATRPDDRYPTPKALAEDLERWMADEPVTAWQEPLVRRARRWARRNRSAVTALAASVLFTLAGTAVVLGVQTQANGRLQLANTKLAIANGRITKVNLDLKSANEREKQRFKLAMAAINLFHGEVSEDLLLKEKKFEGLRTKLLKGAADFYGRLEDLLKDQSDRESRAALGKAYDELGELTSKIGDQTAALGVYGKSLAVRRVLMSEPGADVVSKLDVAQSLNAAGWLQRSMGDMPAALASFAEARSLAEEAASQGGAADQAQGVLGTAEHRTAYTLVEADDMARARASYGRALLIRQKLADANPGVAQFQQDLGSSHNNIGWLLSRTGETAEAQAAYDKALLIRQKLADANPSVTQFQQELAFTHDNIGHLRSQAGDRDGARAAYGQALLIRQKLADANPSVTWFQADVAKSLLSMGWLLLQSGRPEEAVDYFSREEVIWKSLAATDRTVPEYINNLANCQTNMATLLLRLGRPSEARARCEQSVALREVLVSDHPNLPRYRKELAETLLRFGQVRQAEQDFAGASANWRRACALFEAIPNLDSENVFFHARCHSLLSTMAGLPGTNVSPGEGRSEAEKAMDLLKDAIALGYRSPDSYRTESALDPLRDRPDFHALMMDLEIPNDPFAK
jgi:eukaryotic-like serine/threonine-protein kinase